MKQFLIIAILGCLGWNAQAEGTLRLLNTKFDHPQLRDWAAAHPNLVTAQLQRGLDVMGLQDAAGEGKLSQAADSLGLAHGFLTFDYRISGLLASFTEETAGKLLPEIQQKMGAEFGVGAGQPYALLITWISFQGKQLELLFHVNYEGFSRKSSYTTEQLALYKDLSASVFQTGDEEVNAILKIGSLVGTAWSRSASTVMKLYLLLLSDELPNAFFRVNGQTYLNNGTVTVCICLSDTIQVIAYQAPGNLFPQNTAWSGFQNAHQPLTGPTAAFESITPDIKFIKASFKDQAGQDQNAQLRVIFTTVDFQEHGGATHYFDPNTIQEYTSQYERSRQDYGTPKRWVFVPSDGQNSASVTATHPLRVSDLVASSGTIVGIDNNNFHIQLPSPGNQHVAYSNKRCNELELGVFSKPTKEIHAIAVIVNEGNDDVQVIEVADLSKNNNAKYTANTVCITAGPNRYLDTGPSDVGGDDVRDTTAGSHVIYCGPNGYCETKAKTTATSQVNPISEPLVRAAINSTVEIYRKVGVTLVLDNVFQESYDYDRNFNDTLDVSINRTSRNENLRELQVLLTRCTVCNTTENLQKPTFFFVKNMGMIAGKSGGIGHVTGFGIAQGSRSFMFIDQSGQSVGRTVAHEFGYGKFKLKHPWDDFSRYSNTQEQVISGAGTVGQDSFNLMDYQAGTLLRLYQWRLIHP